MGRNNSSLVDQRCKKHPSHRQSKGVCPSCLREKLSQLPSSSSSSATIHSDSSSCSSLSPCSLCDSNLSSLGGSPLHPHHHHQQHRSFSFMFINGGKAMKKSRSLAFVEEKKKEKKKKRGFLSKLIGRRTEKDVGELLHSKTLKARSSTSKWALFS